MQIFCSTNGGNNPVGHCKTTIILRTNIGGVTGFLGSLKISLCEERRLKDTQNLKCEDRRFQNYLVLMTENLVIKPTKLED